MAASVAAELLFLRHSAINVFIVVALIDKLKQSNLVEISIYLMMMGDKFTDNYVILRNRLIMPILLKVF